MSCRGRCEGKSHYRGTWHMTINDNTSSPPGQWLVLAAFIVLCLAVAGVAGWATSQSVATWYLTLNRPSWTPPNWLFAPVWTTLYIMMAVAAWRIWRSGGGFTGRAWPALVMFFVQLALNFAWSFAFFGARSPSPWPGGDHPAVACDRGNNFSVPANRPPCSVVAGAIPGLGQLRDRAEPRDLDPELTR